MAPKEGWVGIEEVAVQIGRQQARSAPTTWMAEMGAAQMAPTMIPTGGM